MFEMPALALTDHHTIAGLPEFHKWAAVYGIHPISGSEITLTDGTHLTLLAENAQGFTNLCTLLTHAHTRDGTRTAPCVDEADLFLHAEGLIILSGCRKGRISQAILHRKFNLAREIAARYQTMVRGSFYLELQSSGYPEDIRLNRTLVELSESLKIPLVATGNVHYTRPDEFPTHDILRCIQLRCDIHTPHPERPLNDGQWLFSPSEAERRFTDLPSSARLNTLKLAERCQVVVTLGASLFPAYQVPGSMSAQAYLRQLVEQGARERYGQVNRTLRQRLEHELDIIVQLGYTDYFLAVWDIVYFARQQRIRCAGRGSAADSAVAYCLYITDVDAAGRGLLFERFMSLERAEKPDIDIDFDSRRREEVMDYVYRTYGENHVARVATYQTFRGRSAIREVGGALGLPQPVLDKLAKRVPWMAHADELESLFDRLPELRTLSGYRQQLQWLWKISAQIAGFPRHFGMHVGGMVISKQPLLTTTSLQPSAQGAWMTPYDKNSVEEVGLVKLDLLSLRTMSAIEDTVVLRERQGKPFDYNRIPLDDTATYARLASGETIGVFQLESPAQRVLQSRLKPDKLEDIVASVALIRPGPIKGNMVDPFLARRHGQEKITYLHPKLEPILGKTYGVVLFQEQVIEIATAIAQFTPGEADKLRRVMSKARSHQEMEDIGRHFLEKAQASGIELEAAETIFSYIKGYASYGFCEAHAAAFGTTAYKTAYLVEHFPAEFYAAILNQYPMGYYPVHVICSAAKRRSVHVLAVDVNRSEWSCTTPDDQTIRLGFCLVKGFRQQSAKELLATRTLLGLFTSVPDLLQRVSTLDRLTAENCVRAGVLDALMTSRRAGLWQLPFSIGIRNAPSQPLLEHTSVAATIGAVADRAYHKANDDLPLAAKLADEYRILGVGVSGHWLDLFRERLTNSGYLQASAAADLPHGAEVRTAGLVVRPHRPPTRSGTTVVFFSLEDETGWIDATMFQSVYERSGAILFTPHGRLVGVRGVVQRRDNSIVQLSVVDVWSLGVHSMN